MVAAQDMGIAVGGTVLGLIGTQAGFGAAAPLPRFSWRRRRGANTE